MLRYVSNNIDKEQYIGLSQIFFDEQLLVHNQQPHSQHRKRLKKEEHLTNLLFSTKNTMES